MVVIAFISVITPSSHAVFPVSLHCLQNKRYLVFTMLVTAPFLRSAPFEIPSTFMGQRIST